MDDLRSYQSLMFVDGCVFYFAVESVQGRLGEICEREMPCPFACCPSCVTG